MLGVDIIEAQGKRLWVWDNGLTFTTAERFTSLDVEVSTSKANPDRIFFKVKKKKSTVKVQHITDSHETRYEKHGSLFY